MTAKNIVLIAEALENNCRRVRLRILAVSSSKWKTIESAKDQFTDEEYKKLIAGAEQVKEIEGKLTILEQKYPECAKAPGNGDSVPADSNGVVSNSSDATSFPSFDGKDLDGNDVKSSELFANSNVTVVNYWFSTCKPCVGELSELEALNKKL